MSDIREDVINYEFVRACCEGNFDTVTYLFPYVGNHIREMGINNSKLTGHFNISNYLILNTNTRYGSHLKYFRWHDIWDSHIVPLLSDPKVITSRNVLLECIRIFLTSPLHVNPDAYLYTQEFLDKLNSLSEREKQRDLIDSFALGKFSPVISIEDNIEFHMTALDKYDDIRTLGHHMAMKQCHYIAPFLWTVCKLLWPEKRWVIVTNIEHTWIMDNDDNTTLYDILYQYTGVNPRDFLEPSRIYKYPNPVAFIGGMSLGLSNPWGTEHEMKEELKCGKECGKPSPNHMIHDIPMMLEVQRDFEWVNR